MTVSAHIDRHGQRPAHAYGVVCRYLPESVRSGAPPAEGVELCVIGSDRAPTWWRMSKHAAMAVIPFVQRAGMKVYAVTYRPGDETIVDGDAK